MTIKVLKKPKQPSGEISPWQGRTIPSTTTKTSISSFPKEDTDSWVKQLERGLPLETRKQHGHRLAKERQDAEREILRQVTNNEFVCFGTSKTARAKRHKRQRVSQQSESQATT